jgi:hypothetical protein
MARLGVPLSIPVPGERRTYVNRRPLPLRGEG